jgi:endonuclease III
VLVPVPEAAALKTRPDSVDLLYEIDRRLRAEHGTRSLGNKPDPLDELVFIQLSIRTREGAYHDGYRGLQELTGGAWDRLLELPMDVIAAAIAGGGMAWVKADRLRRQVAAIREKLEETSLEPLRAMSDKEAEAFLLSLPGVGPKAARCVLMYSLDREAFPVDSHCRRIMDRLGYLPPGVDRKRDHDVLQEIVPGPIRASLHVNFVHHGKSICVSGRPRCEVCPICDLCPTGRNRSARSDSLRPKAAGDPAPPSRWIV